MVKICEIKAPTAAHRYQRASFVSCFELPLSVIMADHADLDGDLRHNVAGEERQLSPTYI